MWGKWFFVHGSCKRQKVTKFHAMSLPSLLCRQLKLARRILFVKKEAYIVRKMDTWSEDKKRFLEMDLDAKRKFYKMKKYVTLDDISTWRDDCEKEHFAATKPLTEADKDQFQEFSIDSSLNKIIASKISIWRGDITELEVCKLRKYCTMKIVLLSSHLIFQLDLLIKLHLVH